MNIIGVSAFYHDAACCLLKDGRLVAAAAQERFSRIKHDRELPVDAFRYCLEEGGLDITDLDCVAYYESPVRKLARQLWAGHPGRLDVDYPYVAIRERLGFEGRIESYEHHLSHAASAYYFSGFDSSALMTLDGVGEWASASYGIAEGDRLELFDEVHYPDSLGLLYSTLTAYLGFRVNSGEYKLMGLAAYGRPRLRARLEQLIENSENGGFRLDSRFFDFGRGARMYSPLLIDLLEVPPRDPEQPPTAEHADLACSTQQLLEDLLLAKARWLAAETGDRRLCLAGGVALNCVANGRLHREGPFREIFIPPAPGDDGAALGAAALAQIELAGQRPKRLDHANWGPRWQADEIAGLLAETPLKCRDFRGDEAGLLTAVVERLAAGQVLGWFQGRMEFGPRALGARSILADPRNPSVRERLNRKVKRREDFRPFAPSVPDQHADDWFELAGMSPFMAQTCAVRQPEKLPAVTHVDGTARPQTVAGEHHPRFARLLEAFGHSTGCPVLLNTSFNRRGEPIVGSPADALICFATAGLDALVLEDCLIDRTSMPDAWPELLQYHRGQDPARHDRPDSGNLYAFT